MFSSIASLIRFASLSLSLASVSSRTCYTAPWVRPNANKNPRFFSLEGLQTAGVVCLQLELNWLKIHYAQSTYINNNGYISTHGNRQTYISPLQVYSTAPQNESMAKSFLGFLSRKPFLISFLPSCKRRGGERRGRRAGITSRRHGDAALHGKVSWEGCQCQCTVWST